MVMRAFMIKALKTRAQETHLAQFLSTLTPVVWIHLDWLQIFLSLASNWPLIMKKGISSWNTSTLIRTKYGLCLKKNGFKNYKTTLLTFKAICSQISVAQSVHFYRLVHITKMRHNCCEMLLELSTLLNLKMQSPLRRERIWWELLNSNKRKLLMQGKLLMTARMKVHLTVLQQELVRPNHKP